MRHDTLTRFACLSTLGFVLAFGTAHATSQGRTEAGIAFLTGGISAEELAEIKLKRPLYNFSVLTVAKPSGAHLSDVTLTITRVPPARGKPDPAPVLSLVMEGPWLLANLEPGTYDLTAALETKLEKMRVTIVAGRDRQVIFRIDDASELSPDIKAERR